MKKIPVASGALHTGTPILAVSYFKRSAVLYVKVLAAPSSEVEEVLPALP